MGDISIRQTSASDGAHLWRLVRDGGTLDLNSSYMYLLAGERFAETTLMAESYNGRPLGFVLGFIPPKKPETIFVWQIGVAQDARGMGLAKKLLVSLCQQPACAHVTHMETTITPSNYASQRLFRSFARSVGASVETVQGFTKGMFPDGKEEELLFRIGRLNIEGKKHESL